MSPRNVTPKPPQSAYDTLPAASAWRRLDRDVFDAAVAALAEAVADGILDGIEKDTAHYED